MQRTPRNLTAALADLAAGAGLYLALLWLWSVAAGCAAHMPRPAPPPAIVEAKAASASAKAHVESARNDVQAATPHADATGQAVLKSATFDLDAAIAKMIESDDAQTRTLGELARLDQEIERLKSEKQTEIEKLTRQHTRELEQAERKLLLERMESAKRLSDAEGYWGYRWGKVIDHILFWLKFWLVAYVALSILGLVVQGPVGAIMSVVAGFMNPFELLRMGRDNLFFRGKSPASVVKGAGS